MGPTQITVQGGCAACSTNGCPPAGRNRSHIAATCSSEADPDQDSMIHSEVAKICDLRSEKMCPAVNSCACFSVEAHVSTQHFDARTYETLG